MNALDVLLAVLAVLQSAWFVAYVTGPWRETRLGWVWLLKGGLLACLWWLLLVDQRVTTVPNAAWTAIGVGLVVATSAWLWATIRARRGDFTND